MVPTVTREPLEAGGGEVEGSFSKRINPVISELERVARGPVGGILPHVPETMQNSHTDRNRNKYPGKIPHRPQRKARQKMPLLGVESRDAGGLISHNQ